MPSPTEKIFREIEQVLDRLIDDTIAQLKEQNVTITDESARTYHYKNPFLSWSYRFESRRPYRGPEIATVTISITWDEPATVEAPREIRVWSQTVIQQIGQVPRWEHKAVQDYAVEVIVSHGITPIVWEHLRKGYTAVDNV